MKKLLYIALFSLPLAIMAQETGNIPPKAASESIADSNVNKDVLEGRTVAERPITPSLNCAEAGKVVLVITVDRQGKVIDAETGQGSTTTAKCLVDYAKSVAMATRFTTKEDAPEKQKGTITFDFKETE